MIASKVLCDDTFSNQSWCLVGQKMFSLGGMNQMEREMCEYLDWTWWVVIRYPVALKQGGSDPLSQIQNATACQVHDFEQMLVRNHRPRPRSHSL
jgi:hypothetical protein